MCFVKHPARVCRLGDGITVSACLARPYLTMTYLTGKGTSYKTGSATSAFGGHGWMNAMKKYEVKLKVFQHIHWLAPLCGLLSWTCFVKHSARDPSVRWWDKGIRKVSARCPPVLPGPVLPWKGHLAKQVQPQVHSVAMGEWMRWKSMRLNL